MKKKGKLYLIPTPIAETEYESLPAYVIEYLHKLQYFIVERARTSRRFIKASGFEGDMQSLHFTELDKRKPDLLPGQLFAPILNGHDMGLMSEAGMPGIADPGALVVSKAHDEDIEVVPLTGPSSLFLALAASGLNGQQFAFKGYLPVKRPELTKQLSQLSQRIKQSGETQLFIETPYRNDQLVRTILDLVNPSLKLCIAMEINGLKEYIKTKSIASWKKSKLPDMHKRTAVFLLGR